MKTIKTTPEGILSPRQCAHYDQICARCGLRLGVHKGDDKNCPIIEQGTGERLEWSEYKFQAEYETRG